MEINLIVIRASEQNRYLIIGGMSQLENDFSLSQSQKEAGMFLSNDFIETIAREEDLDN